MIKKILIIPYIWEGDILKFFVGKGAYSGFWRFPTGHVGDEPHFANESVAQGAKRELEEELGVANAKNFFFTGLKQSFIQNHADKARNGEVEESVFAADVTNLKIKLDEKEFSKYKLLSMKEALNTLEYEIHKKFLIETNEKIANKNYPKIFLLVGPSGSGKGVILKSLLEDKSLRIFKAKTATTRPKRPNETDERIFVTPEHFEQMEKKGELIEKNNFGGYWYGSVKKNVEDILESASNVIMEIDLNGVRSYQKMFSNVVSIFIIVQPDDLRKRLSVRNTESPQDIEKRLEIARIEIQNSGVCDYFVENKYGELDEAIRNIKDIIRRNNGQ